MENPRPEGENIIKDTKIDTTIKDIFLDQKKKIKQLKISYLEILEIFLRMKRKKFIVNQ